MSVRWDEAKRQRVLAERDIDFEQLKDLLYTPYLEDHRQNRSAEAMNSESTEIKDIEEIAQQAHLGTDVSEHFTGHFQVKQQISVIFPLELLRSIDAECQLQNINRQDWIKMVCAEKIREVQASRISKIV